MYLPRALSHIAALFISVTVFLSTRTSAKSSSLPSHLQVTYPRAVEVGSNITVGISTPQFVEGPYEGLHYMLNITAFWPNESLHNVGSGANQGCIGPGYGASGGNLSAFSWEFPAVEEGQFVPS
jgi:hypothetical protein